MSIAGEWSTEAVVATGEGALLGEIVLRLVYPVPIDEVQRGLTRILRVGAMEKIQLLRMMVASLELGHDLTRSWSSEWLLRDVLVLEHLF